MGITDHTPHIFNRIGSLATGTMPGCAHVYGVRTMIDGGNRSGGVTRRREQFYRGNSSTEVF